jgi:hypothetical protein
MGRLDNNLWKRDKSGERPGPKKMQSAFRIRRFYVKHVQVSLSSRFVLLDSVLLDKLCCIMKDVLFKANPVVHQNQSCFLFESQLVPG